jgi:hypothetical protein
MFENFRRNLGKAGMWWSQLVRVNHICKKVGRRKRKSFLVGTSLGQLAAARSVLDCELFPTAPFFCAYVVKFIYLFLVLWGWAWHFGRMGVQHYFLKLASTFGKVKSSIPHGAWRFCFYWNFIFAKFRVKPGPSYPPLGS